MGEMGSQISIDTLSQVTRSLEAALAALGDSSNLVALGLDSRASVKEASNAVSAELQVLSELQDSLAAASDELGNISREIGVDGPAEGACESDSFQGIQFYDGRGFGYLRIKPDKVELLVGENLEFELDGTKPHTYRLLAKDDDIKLYVDGVLAIDGTGKFTQKTTERVLQFGDIGGRKQDFGSAWRTFKYSIEGDVAPGEESEALPEEILSFPGGSIGTIQPYKDALYASFDPNDEGESSCIFKFETGESFKSAPTLAITRSNVTSVAVDPNLQGDFFGASGKYVGTDIGLQYIIGDKLDNADPVATMDQPPEDEGWQVLTNCQGTCHNLVGGILTIDTRNEEGITFFDFRDDTGSEWSSITDNEKGWTVEAVVRVPDDGTSGTPIEDEEAFFDDLAATTGKDLVLVIEQSSLMSANDKASAFDMASYLLRQLNRWDKFGVVLYGQFDNRNPPSSPVITNLSRSLSDTLLDATGENIQLGIDFIKTIKEDNEFALLPDVWAGTSKALDLDFLSPSKNIVLMGTGFSFRGAFPPPDEASSYGTPPIDETVLSFSVIPSATGFSVVKNTSDKNTAGPSATLYTVGIGPMLDSVSQVLPSGTEAEDTDTYQEMWEQLATDSSGQTFRVRSIDNPSDTAVELSLILDPTLEAADDEGDDAISPSMATLTAINVTDALSNEDAQDIRDQGLVPPEDGLHAPGITINDGTYQEVVQFFQRGIRLKYAGLFAPLPLASEFHRIRILGRGKGIAIYAKEETATEYVKVLFSSDALFVRASFRGDVESPDIAVDDIGIKHAVWQESSEESPGGNWTIQYSRTKTNETVARGLVADPEDENVIDLVTNRGGFVLNDSIIPSDPIGKDVLVMPAAELITAGVQEDDVLIISSFIDANGARMNRPRETYRVERVLSEALVRVKGFDDRQAVDLYADESDEAAAIATDLVLSDADKRWHTAEFLIFRGEEPFGVKQQVSTQAFDSVDPTLISHSSGDLFLAYANEEGAAFDIYVRRGITRPRATAWRETVRITRGSGISRKPSMVEIDNGRILIVWQETRTDFSRSQIFYAIIDPEDFHAKVPLRRLADESLLANSPQVVRIPDSNTVIVWEDDLNGTGNASLFMAQIASGSGGLLSDITQLTSGEDDRTPTAVLTKRGIVVAWRRVTDGNGQIFALTVNTSTFAIDELLALSPVVGNARRPKVTTDGIGNIYVAYDDDRIREGRPDVFISAFDWLTKTWVAGAQLGMDIRPLPVSDHDSYDSPTVIADLLNVRGDESQVTTRPRLFAVFRGSNTESDSEILGSNFSVDPDSDNVTFNATVTFEEDDDDNTVFNRAYFLGRSGRNDVDSNGLRSDDGRLVDSAGDDLNTSTVGAVDTDHGFSDIDLGDKRYFHLTDQAVKLPARLMPEDGSIDFWVKPQFASGSGTNFLFGNASLSEVESAATINTFAMADTPLGLRFALVDQNGLLHHTTVPSSEYSWAAGDSTRLRVDWDAKAVGLSRLNAISFKSATKGFACGPLGSVFKTTDGGVTWSKVSLPFPLTYELYSVDYPDTVADVILVAGEFGTILKSDDDGATWTKLVSGTTSDLRAIHHDSTGPTSWAVGSGGEVLKSTDLTAWTQVFDAGTELFSVAVAPVPATSVVVVGGADGAIFRSTNDGTTFVSRNSGVSTTINALSKEHGATTSVVYGSTDDGVILISEDNGSTWARVPIEWPDFAPSLLAISHVGDTAGTWYAVGADGAFAKGDKTGGRVIDTAMVNGAFRAVEARFGAPAGAPSTVVAAGSGTSVMRSTDEGETQDYSAAKPKNFNIKIDGLEPDQSRFSDQPFQWDPTAAGDIFIGSVPGGDTGDWFFFQSVLSRFPDLNDSVLLRKEVLTIDISAGIPGAENPVFAPISVVGQRVEWGSLSSKSRSHWKEVSAFACGPIAPLRLFAWTPQFGMAGDIINDLAFDKAGRLWMATGAGVASLDAAEVFTDIGRFEAGKGVPVNTDKRIINFTNIASGLTSDFITSIATDEDGDVWFGSEFGLGFLPTEDLDEFDAETANSITASILTSQDGLPSSQITSVRALGNRIFVGTCKGLALLTKEKRSECVILDGVNIGVEDGLPSESIRSVFLDEDRDEVYVGTDRGMVRFFFKGDSFILSPRILSKSVLSGTVFNEGILAGTDAGLILIDKDNNQTQVSSDAVGFTPILSQDTDGEGKAWLASSRGLIKLDASCGDIFGSTISEADGLLGNSAIVDFQRYRMLRKPLPDGCKEPVVYVSVNGRRVSSGFDIVPHVPMIVFDEPLRPSDRVQVFVNSGSREVACLNDQTLFPLTQVETAASRLNLFRKRVLPGTITLGGNKAAGAKGFQRMYAVFAVPVDPSGAPATDAWPVSAVEGPAASFLRPVVTGTSVYQDATDPITSLPTALNGAQIVALPSSEDEDRTDDFAILTVDVDSIIYVAYDDRAADIPSWLRSFDPVPNVQRITDLESFIAPDGEERLYASTEGAMGCVFGILSDPSLCDIAAEIAKDNTGPDGCITSAFLTGTTTMRLNLTAEDPVTGVNAMKVSPRSDFKDENGNDLPWIPFAETFDLEVPITETTITEEVAEIDTGTFNSFFNFNGTLLATSSNPGRVFVVPSGSGQGDPTLLFDTGEDDVNALLAFGDLLIVGTSPNGRLFSWDGSLLQPIVVPGTDEVTAFEAFEGLLYIGATVINAMTGIPTANVYTMSEADIAALNPPVLFKQTLETRINGFAIFGGALYWATENEALHASSLEILSDDIVLSTTTAKAHRHTFNVPSGATLLFGLNGTTSETEGHTHLVVNGVIQAADGHIHILNGAMSGKVFKLDPATDRVTIVHADDDFRIATIASSTLDAQGLMFIGTFPNGKILRFVDTEEIFIKSFDTRENGVNKLKFVDGFMFALAGNDFFVFTGTRWEFLGSTSSSVETLDIDSLNGNIFLLTDKKILRTRATASTRTSFRASRNVCAFVNFRDNAFNESDRFDENGILKDCYFACISDQGFSGASGTLGSPEQVQEAEGRPPTFHRITEVDEDAVALLSILGPEPFFSAKKVEKEVGIYESEILNGTTSFVQWVDLSWDAVVPAGTSIAFQVRSAGTEAEVRTTDFSAEITSSGADLTSQLGQFLQFRAILRATQRGAESPELQRVFIQLRTSQAVHYFTTNFVLPDDLKRGILTFNGCKNPPTTDIVFGINAKDSTEFSDYFIIDPNKVFEVPPEHQKKNLRVGIKLISDPESVPIVDEFALLFSLANDAIIRLNLPGQPTEVTDPDPAGPTRTVVTDEAQGHTHTITFDTLLSEKAQVNGRTSINAGHSHEVIAGAIQPSAGHTHDFTF